MTAINKTTSKGYPSPKKKNAKAVYVSELCVAVLLGRYHCSNIRYLYHSLVLQNFLYKNRSFWFMGMEKTNLPRDSCLRKSKWKACISISPQRRYGTIQTYHFIQGLQALSLVHAHTLYMICFLLQKALHLHNLIEYLMPRNSLTVIYYTRNL